MKNGFDTLMAELGLENEQDRPDDFMGTLLYMVDKAAGDDRNRDIFLEYYFTESSLHKIGDKHGITGSRAREIKALIVRRLRHPSNHNILKVGLKAYYEAKIKAETEKSYQISLQDWINANKTEEEKRSERLSSVPIYALDCSVRLRSCLNRGGYANVGEVVEAGAEEVRKVRSLGERCFQELVSILEQYGVKWKA